MHLLLFIEKKSQKDVCMFWVLVQLPKVLIHQGEVLHPRTQLEVMARRDAEVARRDAEAEQEALRQRILELEQHLSYVLFYLDGQTVLM
jgi:hypothetical protein